MFLRWPVVSLSMPLDSKAFTIFAADVAVMPRAFSTSLILIYGLMNSISMVLA